MIYIKKAKNKEFYVLVTGKNNEILSSSETVKTKQSVFKNIKAQKREYGGKGVLFVVDITGRTKWKYELTATGKWFVISAVLGKSPLKVIRHKK